MYDYGNQGGLPELADPQLFSKQFAGDESLFVVFYVNAIQNQAKSIEEGRAIFDDTECVRIIIPGDKNSIIDRPATVQDRGRFAKQYAMFKAGLKEDEQITGTRLDDWPFLTRAQIAEFRYLGLRTVEQLAECREDIVSRVPGLREIKSNAGQWLGKAKGAAEAAKTAKLIADQNSTIESLQRAVQEQAARIEKLVTMAGTVKA